MPAKKRRVLLSIEALESKDLPSGIPGLHGAVGQGSLARELGGEAQPSNRRRGAEATDLTSVYVDRFTVKGLNEDATKTKVVSTDDTGFQDIAKPTSSRPGTQVRVTTTLQDGGTQQVLDLWFRRGQALPRRHCHSTL